MDYPFTSWTSYFAALTESLSTEYYGETYPEYEKQISGGNTDMQIIKGLLDAGCDAQEGLDGFLQALLAGSRYASEMDGIPRILKMFTKRGATPNVDCLFQQTISDPRYFEDEIQSYEIRGDLIDLLSEYVQQDKYCDWSSIEATYWEHISKKTIKKDYKKACFMYLKYCSDFLQAY